MTPHPQPYFEWVQDHEQQIFWTGIIFGIIVGAIIFFIFIIPFTGASP